jgi:cell division transport system permease protein
MRLFQLLRYFLREALSNFWSNRLNSIVSSCIIIFSLFTLGLFLLTAENLARLIARWTDNVRINVFVAKASEREDLSRCESIIKTSPCVGRYKFISEQDALKRFNSFYPEMSQITSELETNPFPPSYEITIRKEFQNNKSVQELIMQLRSTGIVDDVEYDQQWIERIRFIIDFVRIVGTCFGGILIFTAMFSISNVVKLIVLSRKDEIEIMRLVGATNSFIKGPFITEGVVQGLLGATMATLLLYGVYLFIGSRVAALSGPFFSGLQLHFLNQWIVACFLAGGMAVGFAGSFFSLSRLVKI